MTKWQVPSLYTTMIRTTAELRNSFELLQTLFRADDEHDQLQSAKILIELDAVFALEKRQASSPALAKQLEIKMLAVDKLIATTVVERLGYYAIPDEVEGENQTPIIAPGLRQILYRYHQLLAGSDEDYEMRGQLVEILTTLDQSET